MREHTLCSQTDNNSCLMQLDFVKGFDGRHVGDYMRAAEPSFVVRLALELQAKPFAITLGTY